MEEDNKDDAKWSKACFRIFGDELQPDEVSRALSIQATSSGLKGEPFSASPLGTPLRSSVWILRSPLSDLQPIEDHLKWLLDELEPKRDAISEITKQFDVDFFCGFSSENGQGGTTLDASLLARLSSLGASLVLDLYPPGPITLDSGQG